MEVGQWGPGPESLWQSGIKTQICNVVIFIVRTAPGEVGFKEAKPSEVDIEISAEYLRTFHMLTGSLFRSTTVALKIAQPDEDEKRKIKI